jgi:hypothetical protein
VSSRALREGWQAARRRRRHSVLGFGLPLALLPALLGWRFGQPQWLLPLLAAGLLLLAGVAVLYARRLDQRWLQRRLDACAQLEDSADLLFAEPATLGPLQRLQRERLQPRLPAVARTLRERWPWRSAGPPALAAWLALALLLGWPQREPDNAGAARVAVPPASSALAAVPRLLQARLHAIPPAYTGLAAAWLPSLDARQPVGTQLRWVLQFTPQPAQVQLQLHDGQVLALQRHGEDWSTQWQLHASSLYRLNVDGAALDGQLHRLVALPDQPPQVRVLEPEASLVQWNFQDRNWSLQFAASDDYGVAATAQLQVTLVQGSGENMRFHQQHFSVTGTGGAQRRRFAYTLQPQALGMAAGDDLIVQLQVHDNRRPLAQQARSASVILRWPPAEQTRAAELEGAVKKVLPAYFRSQRQIIIDAEALLRAQQQLALPAFVERADAIGVDQRLLRLRYGQFLGEESVDAGALPPVADELPVADTELATADDASASSTSTASASAQRPASTQGAAALDAHDDDQHDDTPGVGRAGDVLAEFGHTHDHAEAATLLDPQTRATLKAALDQMWQSERELRLGQPRRALPYAYKALDYIKQVQQAERIYLARIGAQLPPIDPTRRMRGARDGLAPGADVLVARRAPDPQPLALWQALGDSGGDVANDVVEDFARWLAAHATAIDEALELHAALEAVRATPGCLDCRQRLRGQLWPLLQRPATALTARPPLSPTGSRYLDALQRQTVVP